MSLNDTVVIEGEVNLLSQVDGDPAVVLANIPIPDGSITEAKLSDSLKLKTIKDYVTPEMYGAKGDGVTDDTTAFQSAVNACIANNGILKLGNGKNYKLTSTINITKRIIIDGSGSTVTSTAEWAFYVHSTSIWDGEFTTIRNLYLVCANGIKIQNIRTQVINSMIKNTGTAILVADGSYESIIDSCYLVSMTGATSIGIQCESADVIFNNVTGYGQHIFIKNSGSNIYEAVHGWPLDADYAGSVFFYEMSNGFSATLSNCHSDTYQYAIRSAGSMNHLNTHINNLTCNWASKDEGWLFYAESDAVSNWAFMKADVSLYTLPTTFHVCNVDGAFCLNNNTFKINVAEIEKGANCYVDSAEIIIDGDILEVFLLGSVNTARRTDLELYIPYLTYFGKQESIPVIIDGSTYVGKIVSYGGSSSGNGKLKIQCTTGFTANSGYVAYRIFFTRRLSSLSSPFTNA